MSKIHFLISKEEDGGVNKNPNAHPRYHKSTNKNQVLKMEDFGGLLLLGSHELTNSIAYFYYFPLPSRT